MRPVKEMPRATGGSVPPTAPRQARGASSRRLSLGGAAAGALLLLGAARALGADYSVTPSVTLSEEYTDNVFDSNQGKKSDFITRARPGLSASYQAPLWDWDLNYAYDYRYYAKGSQKDDWSQNCVMTGLVKPVDQTLFLAVSDTYQRVSLDVTRDTSKETLFQNQSDQNVGTVSPYLVLRPAKTVMVKAGYRYINTWYKDPRAISQQSHGGFLDTSYELTPRFFATAGYSITREESETAGSNLTRQEAYLGPRYEYAEKSFIFARGGAIITRYSAQPDSIVNSFWDAGLTHSFDTATLNLKSSVAYAVDPLGVATLDTSYAGSLAKIFQRGTLTLQGSYNEFSSGITEQLNTKRYSAGLAGSYDLSEDWHGRLGLSFDHYDYPLTGITTRKYTADGALNYQFAKQASIGVNYVYVKYASANPAGDNREVSRGIVEVSKTF